MMLDEKTCTFDAGVVDNLTNEQAGPAAEVVKLCLADLSANFSTEWKNMVDSFSMMLDQKRCMFDAGVVDNLTDEQAGPAAEVVKLCLADLRANEWENKVDSFSTMLDQKRCTFDAGVVDNLTDVEAGPAAEVVRLCRASLSAEAEEKEAVSNNARKKIR